MTQFTYRLKMYYQHDVAGNNKKNFSSNFFVIQSQGPMGLRGYPGMMGPKGEAVSKDPCMFLFFLYLFFFVFFFCDVVLNLFGCSAVLILR